jgi:hypothetical protein
MTEGHAIKLPIRDEASHLIMVMQQVMTRFLHER